MEIVAEDDLPNSKIRDFMVQVVCMKGMRIDGINGVEILICVI